MMIMIIVIIMFSNNDDKNDIGKDDNGDSDDNDGSPNNDDDQTMDVEITVRTVNWLQMFLGNLYHLEIILLCILKLRVWITVHGIDSEIIKIFIENHLVKNFTFCWKFVHLCMCVNTFCLFSLEITLPARLSSHCRAWSYKKKKKKHEHIRKVIR